MTLEGETLVRLMPSAVGISVRVSPRGWHLMPDGCQQVLCSQKVIKNLVSSTTKENTIPNLISEKPVDGTSIRWSSSSFARFRRDFNPSSGWLTVRAGTPSCHML
jgi:hypothetical protein